MPFVRILGYEQGEPCEEGRVLWDGQQLRVEPDTPLMREILADPITTFADGKLSQLTAQDGLCFLEGLQHHYRSHYLCATAPEQDGETYAREDYGVLGEGGGGSESGAHLGQTPRKPSGAPQAPTPSAVAKPASPPKPVKLPASPTAAVTPPIKPLLPPEHPHHALAQSLHQHLAGQKGPVSLGKLRDAFGHGKVDQKAPQNNSVHGALMALRDAGHVQVYPPEGGIGDPDFAVTPQPTESAPAQAASQRPPAELFHGSPTSGITQFDEGKFGANKDAGLFGQGAYLAPVPGNAGVYGPNVYRVQHNLQKMYQWPAEAGNARSEVSGQKPLPPEIREDVMRAYQHLVAARPLEQEDTGWTSVSASSPEMRNEKDMARAIQSVLSKRGYDSVEYHNPVAQEQQKIQKEYVALNPKGLRLSPYQQATSHRSPEFAQKFHAGMASFQPDAHETGAQVPLHKLGPALGVPPEQLAQHLHALEQEGVVSLGHHDPSDFGSLPPDPKYAAQEVAMGRLIPDAQHPGHFISWLRYNAGPQGAAYRQLAQGQGVPGVQGVTPEPPQNTEENTLPAQQPVATPALKTPAVAEKQQSPPSTAPSALSRPLATTPSKTPPRKGPLVETQEPARPSMEVPEWAWMTEDQFNKLDQLTRQQMVDEAMRRHDVIHEELKSFVKERIKPTMEALFASQEEDQAQGIPQSAKSKDLEIEIQNLRKQMQPGHMLQQRFNDFRTWHETMDPSTPLGRLDASMKAEDAAKDQAVALLKSGKPLSAEMLQNKRLASLVANLAKGKERVAPEDIPVLARWGIKAYPYLQMGQSDEQSRAIDKEKGEDRGRLLAHKQPFRAYLTSRGIAPSAPEVMQAHAQHGAAVKAALDQGQPVSEDVLQAHPNLWGHPALAKATQPHDAVLSAFQKLNDAAPGYRKNFVSLVDLRKAMPNLTRQQQDQAIQQLRREGKLSLSAAEGRHGITAEDRAAGIPEEDSLLLHASVPQRYSREQSDLLEPEQYGALPIDVLALLQRLQRLGSSPQAVEFAKNLLALLTRFPDLRRALPLQQFVALQRLAGIPESVQSQYGRDNNVISPLPKSGSAAENEPV